ncbi:hypothetical protein [Ruminococcus flavefaciens]|nr:hypothetical protein [Ruminococcus flavefaciens]
MQYLEKYSVLWYNYGKYKEERYGIFSKPYGKEYQSIPQTKGEIQ